MTDTHQILAECLDTAIEFGEHVRFDASYLGHLFAISLYVSMLELTAEILHLNRSGPKPGIPIVARSILEAYVEIKNLSEDEEYIGVVEYSWVMSWLKTMKAARDGNQYLGLIADHEHLDATIVEQEAKLDELRDRGLRHTSIKAKFEKAGMSEEYDTLYGWFSSCSHGGLQALIERHMEIAEGAVPKVSAFQDRPISEFEIPLGTVCEMIVRATDHINDYLEAGGEEVVQKLRALVDEHRSSLSSA